MTRKTPESGSSAKLQGDKNPYENILKDWTLDECYDEAQIDYWDFQIPNHADLKNLEHVDDFQFFLNLVDQLGTPLRKIPVSQVQNENINPITQAMQRSAEEKVDFVKLSQGAKPGSNVDFTKLSLFNSKKNRMSERARRRSQQITIEEDKPKRNGSIGPASRLSNNGVKDQPIRSLSRQNSFTKKAEPVRPASQLSNGSVKDQPARSVSRQNSFTKREPFGPITRRNSAVNNREKPEARNPPIQPPTAREKFILSRREAQKTTKKEVPPPTRTLRRPSMSRPTATQPKTTVNPLQDSNAQGEDVNKNTDKKGVNGPSSVRRETRSSILRAAKIRASIGTGPSAVSETPRRKISLAETPRRKLSLVESMSSVTGCKKETNVTRKDSIQKKIEPLTRARNFDKMLRAYDPPTGHTPKKPLTFPNPFRTRRSASQCRDIHPSVHPPVPQTPGRMSATSSTMDPHERQELIRACVERLSSPRKPRCKGNTSITSDFASSKGSKM